MSRIINMLENKFNLFTILSLPFIKNDKKYCIIKNLMNFIASNRILAVKYLKPNLKTMVDVLIIWFIDFLKIHLYFKAF